MTYYKMTVFLKLSSLVPRDFQNELKVSKELMDGCYLSKTFYSSLNSCLKAKGLSLSCYQECSNCFEKVSADHCPSEKWRQQVMRSCGVKKLQ